MRPAVVILGFVLGSAAAITFALVGTMIVFLCCDRSIRASTASSGRCSSVSGLFSLLTVAAGSSFYGELKAARMAPRRVAALCVMLTAVAAYHAWPRA